jgi:hypothetical protein
MSDDEKLDAAQRELAFLKNESQNRELKPEERLLLRQMEVSAASEIQLRRRAKRHQAALIPSKDRQDS